MLWQFITTNNELSRIIPDIGPQLSFGRPLTLQQHKFRCLGGLNGCFSGGSILLEGAANIPNAHASYASLQKSGEHHPPSPARHFLLGVEIIFLALSFIGGIVLSGLGFKRSSDAAEEMEQEGRRDSVPAFLWFCCYPGGALVAAISLAYGLRLYYGYW